MAIADLLSENSTAGPSNFTSNVSSKNVNYWISQAAMAMALYSASEDDLETIPCFLDFQEINASPKNIQKPVTDRRVSGQAA